MRQNTLPLLTTLALSIALTACGNDSNPGSRHTIGDDHDHDHGTLTGRLITSNTGSHAHAYILDAASGEVITDLHLDYPASAIHASPGHRYAVIVQKEGGQAQIVDSGYEPHGDHVHEAPPALLALRLSGTAPAHYRAVGDQAALFFDTDPVTRFVLFSDSSLAGNGWVARSELPAAHHGIAEPRGRYVLVSNPSRDGVTPYELHGDHFHDLAPIQEPCPGLHGGGSRGDYSGFGCEDGVLLVELHGDHFHAAKAGTPLRVTQVAGHDAVADLVAVASGNQTFYRITPESAQASEFDWAPGSAGAVRAQHAFSLDGSAFVVLDQSGTAWVWDTRSWSLSGSVPLMTDTTDAVLAPGGGGDEMFVLDAAGRRILMLDLATARLDEERTVALDFAPKGLAWTGVPGSDHDHDHDHADHDH